MLADRKCLASIFLRSLTNLMSSKLSIGLVWIGTSVPGIPLGAGAMDIGGLGIGGFGIAAGGGLGIGAGTGGLGGIARTGGGGGGAIGLGGEISAAAFVFGGAET